MPHDGECNFCPTHLRRSPDGLKPQQIRVSRPNGQPLQRCSLEIARVPSKETKREFKVGDRVTVSLSAGRVADGVVIAIRWLQVDYGKDETALVYLWQVR